MTKQETIAKLTKTAGVLGVSTSTFDHLGVIDGANFWPGFWHTDDRPAVGLLLAATLRLLDRIDESQLRVKLEHYSVLAMKGPQGRVAIAHWNGHPAVKSINRPARRLVGNPRYGWSAPKPAPTYSEGPMA